MGGAWQVTAACVVALAGLCLAGGKEAAARPAAVGPRGAVGPGAPLTGAERKRFSRAVVVEGRSAAAVQAACARAQEQGPEVVRLPAGEYAFESTVRVPGGITLVGEGAGTVIKTREKNTHLFEVVGDRVRFTRLRLEGAAAKETGDNESYGIEMEGRKRVRIDHCELLGFSYATRFAGETEAQVDHCAIHHNLREGLGYGVAVYGGAYVLVTDNEFSQNRHSLASNGALDWSSGERLGRYVHVPGARKTHWEFLHNRVGSNDLNQYEEFAVDTHPGMDGSFVVEGNLFEGLCRGVGIRDGSGLIRGNVFRELRTITSFRRPVAVLVTLTTHNDIPVEGALPHDITIAGNRFEGAFASWPEREEADRRPARYEIGEAANITIDGQVVPATRRESTAVPIPRLHEMRDDGRGE